MFINFLLILAGVAACLAAINGSVRPVPKTNPFWI